MENITPQMFNGRTDARLLGIKYEVLPMAVNQNLNITNEDAITIARVDDRGISMEVSRKLVVNPRSLFEVEVKCFLRRSIGDNVQNIPSLKDIDIKKFIEEHKAEMTTIAFINLSHILANITSSFGGTPILTPPAPAQNAMIVVKE